MFCQSCGQALKPTSKFCPRCGTAVVPPAAPAAEPDPDLSSTAEHPEVEPEVAPSSAPLPPAPVSSFGNQPPVSHFNPSPATPSKKGWSGKKIALLVAGVVGVLGVLVLGIVGAGVYFLFSSLKSSDANKAAVAALRKSRPVADAMGEVKETGWPMGSVSTEGGGSGRASFSMSVEGSKAKGTYYSTLVRENNIWRVVSGRVDLSDGRQIEIAGDAEGGGTGGAEGSGLSGAATGGVKGGDGVQLSDEKADTGAWNDVTWEAQKIHLRVPADWKRERVEQRDIMLRSTKDRYLFMAGSAYLFDRPMPVRQMLDGYLQASAEKLTNGIITGYATRSMGPAEGVLTIAKPSKGEDARREVSWVGYVKQGEQTRSLALQFHLREKDFAGLQPSLNAILDSISFE